MYIDANYIIITNYFVEISMATTIVYMVIICLKFTQLESS